MINTFNRSFSTLIAALLLVAGTQEAAAWPSGSGGNLRIFGSFLDIEFIPVDVGERAPVQWIYYDDAGDGTDGRYCVDGKAFVTVEDNTASPSTGTGWFQFKNDKDSNDTTPGLCYFHVKQTKTEIIGADVGAGKAYEYTYEVPSLEKVYTDYGAAGLRNLVQGEISVVPDGSATGLLANCDTDLDANKHCRIRVGFAFTGGAPIPNFFPATVTDNLDPVPANVTLFTNEICTEFDLEDLKLKPTPALEAKLQKLISCEPVASKINICTNINSTDPLCDQPTADGQLSTGSAFLLVGDFLNPLGQDVTCITSIEDLQNLPTDCAAPVNLGVCDDSNGLLEMPTSFLTGACGGSGETLEFGTPDGSGSVTLEVSSISSQGSPGFPGTSNIPPVSADLAAIISTPASTENNFLDFSGTFLLRVAFVDGLGGDDAITGSKGPDVLRGSSGVDFISGHEGNDILQGGDGDDTLNGDCVDPAGSASEPSDCVDGGNDLLLGYECFGPNADCSVVINKGAEVDTLFGGPLSDCLDGGRGNDFLKGGDDADYFVLFGDPDIDTMEDYDKTEGDTIVNLTGNTAIVQWNGKRNAGICQISVGGNNAIIDATITRENNCDAGNYTIVNQLPADQCIGHPATF